jgi:hypothetical protein
MFCLGQILLDLLPLCFEDSETLYRWVGRGKYVKQSIDDPCSSRMKREDISMKR